MAAATDSASPQPAKAGRVRRWRRRVLLACCALVGLVVVALGCGLWLLTQLQHPLIKPRVLAAAAAAGLELEYARLSVSPLSGRISASGLRIAQPARFAEQAPALVSLSELRVELEPRALLSGRVHIDRLELQGLALGYAVDESADSLSLLFPAGQKPKAEPTAPAEPAESASPLSHSLRRLRGLGVTLAHFEIREISLEYVELEAHRIVRRLSLQPLRLSGHLQPRADAVDLALALGPTERGGSALLRVSQQARAPQPAQDIAARAAIDGSARLALDVSLATVAPANVRLRSAMRVVDASGLSWPAGLPLDAALELAIGFDEGAGRTSLQLSRLALFGDTVAGQLSAQLLDASPDTLRDASGHLDLHSEQPPWLPAGVQAQGVRARVVLQHAQLSAHGVLGQAALQAQLRSASSVGSGHSASVEGLELGYQSDAEGGADAASGTLSLRSGALRARAAGDLIELPAFTAEARLRDVRANAAGLFGLGGGVRLALSVQGKLQAGSSHVQLGRFTPTLDADFDRRDISAQLPLQSVSVRQRGKSSLQLRGARLRLSASDPLRWAAPHALAGITLEGELGRVEAAGASFGVPALRLVGKGDASVYTLGGGVSFAKLSRARQTLAGTQRLEFTGRVDLQRHAAELEAHLLAGSLARLPEAKAQPLPPAAEDPAQAKSVASTPLQSSLKDQNVPADAPRGNVVAATSSRARPLATAAKAARAHAGPSFELSMHAALEPQSGAVVHRIALDVQRLAPALAPLLPQGMSADFGGLHVQAEGTLTGLFSPAPAAGAVPAWSGQSAALVRGEEHAQLTLDDFAFAQQGGAQLACPRLALNFDMSRRGQGALLELKGELGRAVWHSGGHQLALVGLKPQASVRIPNANNPRAAALAVDVRLDQLEQDYAPGYPVGQLSLRAAVEAAGGRAQLSELLLSNPPTRSSLRMTGAYESELGRSRKAKPPQLGSAAPIDGREAFSLSGTLEQDLAALAGGSLARRAKGTVRVPFSVQSGDLRSFRSVARVVAEAVDFTSPDGRISIARLNGEIPVEQGVTLSPGGVELDAGAGWGELSRARFPDVQPFLNHDAFVTADRIVVGDQQLGPLAGNVRVSGTNFSVDRLQLGYRGGSVTGQLGAELKRGAALLVFRGNATGIHTAHGGKDVLDANLALRFAPESLALDGSVQLVRLSRAHLYELLDLLDPYHEDPPMNKVRAALGLGYPKFARLQASEGLMDFEISLGGLAGAVSIDPIRAIPIAPLLSVYVAPHTDALFPPRNRPATARPLLSARGQVSRRP